MVEQREALEETIVTKWDHSRGLTKTSCLRDCRFLKDERFLFYSWALIMRLNRTDFMSNYGTTHGCMCVEQRTESMQTHPDRHTYCPEYQSCLIANHQSGGNLIAVPFPPTPLAASPLNKTPHNSREAQPFSLCFTHSLTADNIIFILALLQTSDSQVWPHSNTSAEDLWWSLQNKPGVCVCVSNRGWRECPWKYASVRWASAHSQFIRGWTKNHRSCRNNTSTICTNNSEYLQLSTWFHPKYNNNDKPCPNVFGLKG